MSTERPIVVMGVSGVGKTTVGIALAGRLGIDFIDADDLHSAENVAKMSAGIPLVDADRWPWLDRVGAVLDADPSSVVACSALRRIYRDRLRATAPRVLFVHLDAAPERVALQANAREDHFMPPALLRSQLETLEPLDPDENGLTIVVDAGPAELADRIVALLPHESEHREK